MVVGLKLWGWRPPPWWFHPKKKCRPSSAVVEPAVVAAAAVAPSTWEENHCPTQAWERWLEFPGRFVPVPVEQLSIAASPKTHRSRLTTNVSSQPHQAREREQ